MNPHATLDCLERAFGGSSIEELLLVGPGRRHLIWAIENLCFWADAFERAASLLLKFAAAENEKISNNATGQFTHLFHVALPGTKADLEQRLLVLDEGLKSSDSRVIDVLLKAMREALEFSHFHRTVGVEQQGSRYPEKDYSPNYAQVLEYWEKILDRLKTFAYPDNDAGKFARKTIAGFFLALIRYKMISVLKSIIEDISIHRKTFWTEGLQGLLFAYKHESSRLTADEKAIVDNLINVIGPKTISEKFKLWISVPSYHDYETDALGNITDMSAVQAKNFGAECAQLWPNWKENLDQLLVGEQRQSDTFGAALAKDIPVPEQFINAVLEKLEQIPYEDTNPSLLGGFLAELKINNPILVAQTLDRVAANDKFCRHCMWLMARSGIEKSEIDRAINLLKAKKIDVGAFLTFRYGSVLKKLPSNVMIELASYLESFEPDGPVVALTLLFAYSYMDNVLWSGIKTTVRELLMKDKILSCLCSDDRKGDLYHWQQFTLRLFAEESRENEKLAIHITREIVSLCGSQNERLIYPANDFLPEVLKVILSQFYAPCWPLLGETLLSEDWHVRNDLEIVIGNKFDFDGTPGLMFDMPVPFLIDWCKQHGTKAQMIVANVMPVFELNPDTLEEQLRPFAAAFIDEFGDNEEVLRQIAMNLSSFGSVDSLAPYWQSRINIMEKLTKHKRITVRKWAQKLLLGLQHQLEQSKKRDAEHAMGIFESNIDNWL